jgi:hypothetical protein
MSGPWDALARELDAWGAAGRIATLWWRDDDATRPTPELGRLLDIAGRHGVPLALAVIPAPAVPDLAQRLTGGTASVLQHGFAHRSHAGPGEKKAELGTQRPAATVLAELAEGRVRLARLFAGTAVPVLAVLVPPWNRIAGSIVAGLAATGFTGLSTYNARAARLAAPGLLQINTHADIVDWHGSRGFAGEAEALRLIVGHLAARRLGAADGDEPTGLITHHLVHDAACWNFCDLLAARVAAHPAARWLAAPDIFNMRPTGGMA